MIGPDSRHMCFPRASKESCVPISRSSMSGIPQYLSAWALAWRRLARRSGTEMPADNTQIEERALLNVLDRGTPLDALAALEYSLSTTAPGGTGLSLNETAIVLDTNVLLKLASHRKA